MGNVLLCLTVLFALTAFYRVSVQLQTIQTLANSEGEFLVGGMPKSEARFRLSIKDNKTRTGIKVELIDAPGLWGEWRYRLRLNGREPNHVQGSDVDRGFRPAAPLARESCREISHRSWTVINHV